MSPKLTSHELHEHAIQSVDLGVGWMQKILELDKDDLAVILGDLANKSKITNSTLKRVRMTLPSFSVANLKWEDFAERSGLPWDPGFLALRLQPFETPYYALPSSFHEAIIENAWRAQDVYREKSMHWGDEALIRLLDPVC